MSDKYDGLLDSMVERIKTSSSNHNVIPVCRKGIQDENEDITIIAIRGNVGHAYLLLEHYNDAVRQLEEKP